MGKLENTTTLTPKQRALLELRLKERREAASACEVANRTSGRQSLVGANDDENLILADSVDSVDRLLAKFYGMFPWPWQPMKFDFLEDTDFETDMLNQDIGDWTRSRIPSGAQIWVAGCGTNQALHTALKFPNASVTGSDISAKSLEICGANARQLDISNLTLIEESINHVTYEDRFDYVVCTGVIHHNADPKASLQKLARSLKPDGVLELMVYNRYHRIVTSAFQKAVRIFGENEESIDFQSELFLAKTMAENFPVKEVLEKAFIQYMEWSESDLADLLIQPVEHSYTVESLETLASACGLELLIPCISLYAKSLASALLWNLEFRDHQLQLLYDSLPDSRRWQITNLMLHEKSPLLWFSAQRKDSPHRRRTEKQVCEEFLDTVFEKNKTAQRSFIRQDDGTYGLSPNSVPYPLAAPETSVREVFQSVDGKAPMLGILGRIGIEPSFQTVNKLRNRLATSAFPYLKSVRPE